MGRKRDDYEQRWQSLRQECPQCGWSGELDAAGRRTADLCAECQLVLAAVYGADDAGTEREGLDSRQRAAVDEIERRLDSRRAHMDRVEGQMLHSADQLPDLDAAAVTVTWDVERPAVGEITTVLRTGDRVLWRELAGRADRQRFAQVAGILREKYGERLEDLVPTRQAELQLYGDSLGAVYYIDAVRRGLRQGRQDLH